MKQGSLAGAATELLGALFFEGMGEPVAAATDLLDALNSDRTMEFSGPTTIVLGDTGGCTALETDLHGTLNSRGVFGSIAIGSIRSRVCCQCPGEHW